ncbi:DUF4397 domain-containing protein [Tellurirhabdus rosea]|uniref:DUF4397 domain-containing protein n=1 Tax=Tellurirhabdus rosea TaxID=2674997 RepID=UPI00225C3C21|nr:DUF4397 domain-containing protein [Tellurirhabdus rosea]
MLKKLSYFLLSAAALLTVACEKNTIPAQDEPVVDGARIKLVHSAPETAGVNLFLNDKKISANTPTSTTIVQPITYGLTFPNSGANYAVVPAGQYTAKLSTPASGTATSETVVSTQQIQLQNEKYYSLLLGGTAAQPVTVLLNDELPGPDNSKFYVRFVNLIPGGQPYDLILRGGSALLTGITAGTASQFVAVDVNSNVAFDLRAAGTTTNIGTGFAFTSNAAGRVVTLIAQGLPGRTGAVAPRLGGYVNR